MNRRKQAIAAAILVLFVFTSVSVLDYTSVMAAPFIASLLVATSWALAIVLFARSEAVRNVALVCVSIFFSMSMIETLMYYTTNSEIIISKTMPAIWRVKEMNIGSLPMPNTATRFREFLGGRTIADVTYRIDGNGLRQIPAAIQGGPHKVAFFGCSFMFGHGVENEQTLPYYFVRASRGRFQGFNFAGEGWGPHQMLREIETGFVRHVAGVPELAIYEAIPDHLRRAAGRAPWEDGPKYVLCRGDQACYAGPFHNATYQRFRRWLDRSWTVKFLESHFAELSRPCDLPLFLAVLKRVRALLEQQGTHFVIVLWDQNELAKLMLKTLKENHFDVVALSAAIPMDEHSNYPITQLDRHPSPGANQAIATYLWRNIAERSLTK